MDRTDQDLLIKPATASDVEALFALVQACVSNLRRQGIEQWDEAYPTRATIETDVAAGTAFVARCERGIVGIVALDQHQESEYGAVAWRFAEGPALVVHRLMIHPDAEGQGLARTLMTFAEKHALASGCACIRLDAFAENPRALHLYQRLGYRDAGDVHFRKGLFRCFEKDLTRASASNE